MTGLLWKEADRSGGSARSGVGRGVSLLQEVESCASVSCQHTHLSHRHTEKLWLTLPLWTNLQSAASLGSKVVRLQPPLPPIAPPSFPTVLQSEHPDEEEGRYDTTVWLQYDLFVGVFFFFFTTILV